MISSILMHKNRFWFSLINTYFQSLQLKKIIIKKLKSVKKYKFNEFVIYWHIFMKTQSKVSILREAITTDKHANI